MLHGSYMGTILHDFYLLQGVISDSLVSWGCCWCGFVGLCVYFSPLSSGWGVPPSCLTSSPPSIHVGVLYVLLFVKCVVGGKMVQYMGRLQKLDFEVQNILLNRAKSGDHNGAIPVLIPALEGEIRNLPGFLFTSPIRVTPTMQSTYYTSLEISV